MIWIEISKHLNYGDVPQFHPSSLLKVLITHANLKYLPLPLSVVQVQILQCLFPPVTPTILESPVNRTVVQPQSATFLCNATARPRAEITWWRMGSQLMERPGVIEIITSTFGEREIVSNLTIIMADPSDAGGYACNATNAAGQDTTAAELTVHGKEPSLTYYI